MREAEARREKQEQDEEAGLGCGTGEVQRADQQEAERLQQRASKRQAEAAAQARRQQQLEMLEVQMEDLELAAENSTHAFQRSVADVLPNYSKLAGKGKQQDKEDIMAEIEMIRALVSRKAQGQELAARINLLFRFSNIKLVLEPRDHDDIVLKNDITRYMQQFTESNDDKKVRVTMLSHLPVFGEKAPQAIYVDIEQPQVALATLLRAQATIMIKDVKCDVTMRTDKSHWVQLCIDNERGADVLHTIVAKWIAAGLTDADIESILLANVQDALPEWKAKIATVYIDDTKKLGLKGAAGTYKRLRPSSIGRPTPVTPRIMVVLGDANNTSRLLEECENTAITIRLLGPMAELDKSQGAQMYLKAIAQEGERVNETWEQLEANMTAGALTAIQALQERWEADESAIDKAADDGIADESLVQMITDITGVLAAIPEWAPQALARAISLPHSPEIPPQEWAQRIRECGNAQMLAMMKVKWTIVAVTGVPTANLIADKKRCRVTWLRKQFIGAGFTPQSVQQLTVVKESGKQSTPSPQDKFAVCLEERVFQAFVDEETGPLTSEPRPRAGMGRWKKENLNQSAAHSGKTTDLTLKWSLARSEGWAEVDDEQLAEKVLALLAEGHGIWVASKHTGGKATQDTGEDCTHFVDLPEDKSKKWLVQNVWQQLGASPEQQSLKVLGYLRERKTVTAMYIRPAGHHVYVLTEIRQSLGLKEGHETLLEARSGEDVQPEIIAALDETFQIDLLKQIDKEGIWAEGNELGTITGTAAGDDGAALPLEKGRFWQDRLHHFYATPERTHHGRQAIQQMTRLKVLEGIVKGGHVLLMRASSEYGSVLISLGQENNIHPGLPVPFAQIQPDEASMAKALKALRQSATARGGWIIILSKSKAAPGTNILRGASAIQSAPDDVSWKGNTLPGLAPESDLIRHGLPSLLIGINKWILENTAKAVAVENVGILLVLTTDAWPRVYGGQAFSRSAQRELAEAAAQGRISEKLQVLANDWLKEEIEEALQQQPAIFLQGARWEEDRATKQHKVEMIPEVVIADPIHIHDLRHYVTSPFLYEEEGFSGWHLSESLSAPARQVVERWEYKLNLTNGLLLLPPEHELCTAIDGMDSQDTVLKFEGNALYGDDIKYILTQIGPSYNNRAAGGNDDRMIELNKREAEKSSDTAKKPRASNTEK